MKTLRNFSKLIVIFSTVILSQVGFAQDSNISFDNIDLAELDTSDDYSKLIAKVKKQRLALINELISSAEEFYKEGNYDKAAQVYEYIIEDNAIDHLAAEVIEKGAESNYLAANFSTAYEWYDELYKKKGNNMSAQSYENYTLSMLRLNSLVSTAVSTMIPENEGTSKKEAQLPVQKTTPTKIETNNTSIYESFVAGIIKNSADQMELEGVAVELIDAKGQVAETTTTNLVGSFFFEQVKFNATYTIRISKDGFTTNETKVDLNPESLYEELDLTLTQGNNANKAISKDFDLNPVVLFDYNNHKVSAKMAKELDAIIDIFKEHPNMEVGIETHTDARGSKSYNQRLSQKRAEAIKDYLIDNGLNESNISHAVGFGEDNLINDCGNGKRCGKELHQLNRRAEFKVVLNH